MSEPYPVIEQRSLDLSHKRGFLGLGRRYREGDELPKPNAHHVLVYRVGGQYILDNAELPLDADQVTDASHVSLVDITRDFPVMVQLDIPSAEASYFTMQVTFVCTVTDPVTVVRAGLRDAQTTLRAYLKSHHKIFELGLDYQVKQINEVRRDVNAQVKAFTTIKPPVIAGISIEMASVEVLTPDELVAFEKSRRDLRRDHTLIAERQHYDHTLEFDQARHGQRMSADALRHEQTMEADKRGFERHELGKLMDMVGDDPVRALHLAYAAGQLSPKELSDHLSAEQRRRQELDRADRLSQLEREREDRMLELERDHEDKRWARENELRIIAARREDALRTQQWQREDETFAREDQHRRLEVNLEVIRELAKRGHLDTANLNVERVVTEMLETPAVRLPAQEPTPELAGPTGSEQDGGVREEDVN